LSSKVAAPQVDGSSLSLKSRFSSSQPVRSSTWPASTYDFSTPPPQPKIRVGAWLAPTAVLILVLYGSFWKKVASTEPLPISLNAVTEFFRMVSFGSPLRAHMVAPPPLAADPPVELPPG
jgi:hypothetical protein